MRIGIYDRWLKTLGGGERYVCTMAACLSAEHQVELICEEPVESMQIEERLGIDVGATRIVAVSATGGYRSVIERTRTYDLFINASHLDYFPSFARNSVLLVFFPAKLTNDASVVPAHLAVAKTVKRQLARWLVGQSAGIRLVYGFDKPERTGQTHFRRIGEQAAFLVPGVRKETASLRMKLSTDIDRTGDRPARLVASFNGIEQSVQTNCEPGGFAYATIPIPRPALKDYSTDVLVEISRSDSQSEGPVDNWSEHWPNPALAWAKLAQPAWREALADTLLGGDLWYLQNWAQDGTAAASSPLDSYQHIWAISGYTQRWITEYWGRTSQILFPPCDPVPQVDGAVKRNKILSVGRFFEGSHNKKHIPMIQAFKNLCDRGLKGWEYHLVGGFSELPDHIPYMQAVESEAKGYPIFIHKNAPLEQLYTLYRESKLFWHATGLGEDDDEAPESFEHFGITTVEAMSAGCVPVVIGKAGQLEIVSHGMDGYLWTTLDQLVELTNELVNDESLCHAMSDRARARSSVFGRDAFDGQLLGLVRELG